MNKVEYSDRNTMHYTMSVMTELLRIGIALSTLLHVASEDVVIRGQKIPKGRDHSHWKNNRHGVFNIIIVS